MMPFVISLLGVTILQVTLISRLPQAAQPDLFLLLLFFLSLVAEPERAIIAGFALGLYQDALSGAPLGLRAFTLSLVGFLASSLSREFDSTNLITQFALLGFTVLLSGLTTLALLGFFFALGSSLFSFLEIILSETLSTAALGFLLALLRRQHFLEVRL